MSRYAALLICMTAIGIAACQQPAKELKPQERPVQKTGNSSSKSGKNGNDTQSPGQNTGNGQQGTLTYQGLTISEKLSRSPQELREMIIQERQNDNEEAEFNDKGQIVKYIEKETEYDISAAFGDNLLLESSQNSIYPGAVLRGDSIDKDSYQEIIDGSKRKAVISFDLQGVKDKEGKDAKPGITSGEIVPDIATYRELRNKILSQNITYHASANSSYEEVEIKNEKSLDAHLKIGVGFGAAGIKSKIAGGFKFKKGEQKERRLIKFVETFYTADVKPDAAPLMINIPRSSVGDRMPVYVSSVSYGRIAYLTIETEKKWSDLKADIDAVFKASTTNNASADVNAAIRNIENEATVSIHIIGGGGKAVTNLSQFQKYIVEGGFSSKNPGQIIKYHLKFLDDNTTAYIKYGEKYKTVERIETPAKGYTVTAKVIKVSCTGCYSAKVSGSIGIRPDGKDTLCKTIFHYDGTQPGGVLLVKNDVNGAKPRTQPNTTIIVPAKSSVSQLSFNIAAEIDGVKESFVTGKHNDNPLVVTLPAGELKDKMMHTFEVHNPTNPKQKLAFDIKFAVEKES